MDSDFDLPVFVRQTIARLTAALVLLFPAGAIAQTAQDEYALAMSFYSRGEYAGSVSAFSSVIRRYPNTLQSSESKFYLGEALTQQGDYGLAFPAFQGFLTELPNHNFAPRATFRLGESAYHLGRNDQAIRLLEEFALRYPANPINEIGLAYLGELRLRNKEPQLAQRVFDSALKEYPNGAMANSCRLGLAKSLQRQGEDVRSLELFSSLFRCDDKAIASQAHFQTGLFAFKAGNFETSRIQLSKSLDWSDEDSRAEAGYWIARSWMAEDSFTNAVREFKNIFEMELQPELEIAAYRDAAYCATQTGESKLAHNWLSHLQSKFPDNAVAAQSLRLRIDLAYREMDFQDCLKLSAAFIDSFPNHELKASIKETVGRIQYDQGSFDQADQTFSDLIREHSHDEKLASGQVASWKYLLALSQIGHGNLEAAIDSLETIRFADCSKELASLIEISRASSLSALKKYTKAIDAYRNYLSLEPGGTESERARAELCVALGKTKSWREADKAFVELRSLHSGQPVVIETAQFLAKSALADKQHEMASVWYEFLIQPGHSQEIIAEGLSGLAWTSMNSNDYESALKRFDRLLTDYPDSDLASEAAMTRAQFLDQSKNYVEAETMYRLVLEKFPDSDFARVAMLRRAFALQKINGKTNLRAARELLTDYIQLPGSPDALDEAIYQLAWVYHDLELPERSHEKFKIIIADFPESKFWADAAYRMAHHYVKQKDLVSAQPLVTRLIESDSPVDVLSRAVFLQGQIAGLNGDWDLVADTMGQLVLRSDDARLKGKASYWLSESLFKTTRFAEAQEILDTLLTEPEQIEVELRPWIALRQAQCLVQLDNFDAALEAAELGSASYPDFKAEFEFDFICGRVFSQQGKFEEAKQAFEAVIRSEQGKRTETAAIAQWRVGEVYFHQELWAEAIGAYEKVVTKFPYLEWQAAALIQAGKCQEHLGNWTQAVKLYRKLVRDHPDSEFKPDAESRLVRALQSARLDDKIKKKR